MNTKRSLFFDTSLIYFLVIVGFVGIRIASNLVQLPGAFSEVFNISIQVILMLLLPFLAYKILRKKKTIEVFKDFNIKAIGIKAILITLVIGFLIYFLNLVVAGFFNIFIYSTGYDPSFGLSSASAENGYSTIMFLGDILVTAILPGICEEFCHRGLLVNGYKQLGTKKTIFLVGFLFGLMHLNIEQFFYASIIGMFLTYLVFVTGSIIPSMIVHFMNNAMGLYVSFASYHNLPLGNLRSNLVRILSGNVISVLTTMLFIMFILVTVLTWLVFSLFKQTRVREYKKLAEDAIARKERESILDSFNLDINELDVLQGIKRNEDEPEVIMSSDTGTYGRKGVILDIRFQNQILNGDCSIRKPSITDKAFLIGTIFIGIFITISTLIWGLL